MDERLAVSVGDETTSGMDGEQTGEVDGTISGDVIDLK